mmetsp:Transcript_13727/g.21201  ORF Transcript_13727/g.21201 Transcript_13727/m.21201 type:complete len:243 (-) Transcript_13727:567-1295(-)|eukprot:CAMPEP_0201713892 /NCGR_PEP_ID=MMETSP0593-20130828/570_1 /ASSEMBLY_ACC=CAM_ASM_000672 /TAXON_ID=267983 /ORGANISM="Skeletonema japonicum, Strain CCMP2506" /LENGTH=242 /DNA_ID=CAMNT_0048203101 /DNA_START=79 /DNA_END=807 /DNA_ORIENTATION=-
MSSWDRSRLIPWSRAIPVAPATSSGDMEDVDLLKERIWRDLSWEAAQEEKERKEQKKLAAVAAADGQSSASSTLAYVDAQHMQQSSSSSITTSSTTDSDVEKNILGFVGRPYLTSDLLKNAAFGATIGSITGMCFGFMDSIRSASSSTVLKSASRSAQGKFVFQGTYRSGMFFGGFFGLFHTVKYATRVLVDPGDAGEICAGSLAALGGVMAKREWRVSMPYAVMLVAMDSFHVFMREDGKA